MVRTEIEKILASSIESNLVTRLLDNYEKATRDIQTSNYPDGLVASGRFAENIFTILNWKITGVVDFNVQENKLYKSLEGNTNLTESERVHVFRAARDIYALRNRKQGAHESDIDPTQLDANYIVHTMRWVLAELIRIHHSKNDEELAVSLVDSLVKRETPMVEIIDGYPVILTQKMSQIDKVLLVVYFSKNNGVIVGDVNKLLCGELTKSQISTALFGLVKNKQIFRNPETGNYKITRRGIVEVEDRIMKSPS